MVRADLGDLCPTKVDRATLSTANQPSLRHAPIHLVELAQLKATGNPAFFLGRGFLDVRSVLRVVEVPMRNQYEICVGWHWTFASFILEFGGVLRVPDPRYTKEDQLKKKENIINCKESRLLYISLGILKVFPGLNQCSPKNKRIIHKK